ncbi:serine/threonine protein kinase [Streptomyces sp. XY431]|uniref:serine/threonine-protein kinase n=1 Tax=Streptomyces sp. XY431 TaxID=1415562 RepID=UPI0006AFBFCF|nr:serine/threonine-protein kinase [Streptomyces sp. XY431]KOV13082.1 serine/threonine protein kinase [Streptomyces sp. XY431]
MAAMPEKVGRYFLQEELGSGGMGTVYKAYTPAGDPVAVKLIRRDQLEEATRLRFEREAAIAKALVATNRVARFLEADPFADQPWMAMEYVPGRTLRDHVEAEGPLPPLLVASLGALLAEGLDAAHRADLVHRDLKPQNVMLGADGPVIIDFGLGAFTVPGPADQDSLSHQGLVIGSIRCMPPEQAAGNPQVTSAADVYGLGAVLLYAAAGCYAYDGASWDELRGRLVDPATAPDLGALPTSLRPLVSWMLAQNPQDRPTLDQVAEHCGELIGAVGLTPVDARLLLMSRTAPQLEPVPELTESLQRRLEQAEAEPAVADDAAETAGNPQDSYDQLAMPLAPATDREPEPGTARAVRVPASRRIADTLRREYAAATRL